ncbi:MAG: CoA transferase subunit A [Alphaproteobacteria bacterium]
MSKETSIAGIVDQIESGMTIGIGGWGARRKPMAVVREILRRDDLKDLTVVSYGGMDVGLLAASGQLKKLVYGFVSLDSIPLEAQFRAARQAGSFEVMEIDEGMLQLGLKAAAQRVSFLPTPVGLASGVLEHSAEIKTIDCPYGSGETYVAMPALPLDVALCHVNRADKQGNSWIYGPDPFFDEWFARAADKVFLTCEELVDQFAYTDTQEAIRMPIERSPVKGVAHVPFGAHPTSCAPDYGIDIKHLKAYSAAQGEDFTGWRGEQIDGVDHDQYIAKQGGGDAVRALPLPIF